MALFKGNVHVPAPEFHLLVNMNKGILCTCHVCLIHPPLTSYSSLSSSDSRCVLDECPVSSKVEGEGAGLCPRILSSSLKINTSLHVCFPLPVLPLLSLSICLSSCSLLHDIVSNHCHVPVPGASLQTQP